MQIYKNTEKKFNYVINCKYTKIQKIYGKNPNRIKSVELNFKKIVKNWPYYLVSCVWHMDFVIYTQQGVKVLLYIINGKRRCGQVQSTPTTCHSRSSRHNVTMFQSGKLIKLDLGLLGICFFNVCYKTGKEILISYKKFRESLSDYGKGDYFFITFVKFCPLVMEINFR